jgi:hypothetical protein
MGFMYLALYWEEDGISADVIKDGELRFRSLGSENSRIGSRPFSVFQIEHFTGLSNINTNDLEREVIRRIGADGLLERLKAEVSDMDLINELGRRHGQGNRAHP